MLHSSLKRIDINIINILKDLNIDGHQRAENLTINDYCKIFKFKKLIDLTKHSQKIEYLLSRLHFARSLKNFYFNKKRHTRRMDLLQSGTSW